MASMHERDWFCVDANGYWSRQNWIMDMQMRDSNMGFNHVKLPTTCQHKNEIYNFNFNLNRSLRFDIIQSWSPCNVPSLFVSSMKFRSWRKKEKKIKKGNHFLSLSIVRVSIYTHFINFYMPFKLKLKYLNYNKIIFNLIKLLLSYIIM